MTLECKEQVGCCPLCNTAEISELASCRLSYCVQCHFHFLNSRPAQTDILASYNTGNTFAGWQNELAQRAPLWEKRLKLIRRYKRSGRLLDIGTGDGFFLEFASRYFDVDATEVSVAGIRQAAKRGYQPMQASIDSLAVNALPNYDVITLWHVLEHLPDPGAALRKARALLKPDGVLLVAVPNESLPLLKAKAATAIRGQRMDWPTLYWGEEIHLGYFTPNSLKRGLLNAGLEIKDTRVDDVHLLKSVAAHFYYYTNCMLNSLFAWHLEKAMVVVAGKSEAKVSG